MAGGDEPSASWNMCRTAVVLSFIMQPTIAFSKWPEFNKICALGGWEGRNENSGPYVYWKDGKLVKDSSAGPGGSHGRQHEYVLNGA